MASATWSEHRAGDLMVWPNGDIMIVVTLHDDGTISVYDGPIFEIWNVGPDLSDCRLVGRLHG